MSDQAGVSATADEANPLSSGEKTSNDVTERHTTDKMMEEPKEDANGNVPEKRQIYANNNEGESILPSPPCSPPRVMSGTQRPGSRTRRGSGSEQGSGTKRPVSEAQPVASGTQQASSDTKRPDSASKPPSSASAEQNGKQERQGSETLSSETQSSDMSDGAQTKEPTEAVGSKVQQNENVTNATDVLLKSQAEESTNDSVKKTEQRVSNTDKVDAPNTDMSLPAQASTEASQAANGNLDKKEEAVSKTSPVASGVNTEASEETVTHPRKVRRSSNRPASVTVEEAQKIAKTLMEKLLAIEVYDSNETMEILKAIGRLYWDYKPRRAVVSEVLLAMDFAGLAVKYLETFNKLGIFKSDTVWFPTYYILNNTWNYTDSSKELAKDFADKGIIQMMIANITHTPYLENIGSKNVSYVLKSSLSILQNVSKIPEVKQLYLENKAIEALKPFTTSENDFFKAVSMMTLTTIINEADNAVLEDTGVIPFIVFGVKHALSAKARRYRGFTPMELVDCLARMAVNDSNKMKIVDKGALPHLVEVLKHSDPAEQASAAQCLWTLSFDNEVRDRILQEPGCIELLEVCASSEDKALRVAATGAIWKLRKEAEHATQRQCEHKEEGEAPLDDHIMISYNWSHQKLILEIAEKLKVDGYKVWLDVDQMGGSTLGAMAEAVEKAAVVMVCLSEKYKLSPNCRTEGEYTFQLHKPIVPLLVQRKYRADGWLGMLIGTKLYTDFSGKHPFEKAYRMLLKELNGRGHLSQSPTVVKETAVVLTQNVPSPAPRRPVSAGSPTGLASWSKQQVAQWLTKHQLESCLEQFSEMDGRLMSALVMLRREAPEYFYNTLEKKFWLDIHTILQLINAMEALP